MKIHDVKIIPLKQILDERGKVMHMLRADSSFFEQFGEIYFSCAYPGAVKAWHFHEKMTLNYAVPHGNIKMALYDDRPDSPTNRVVQEIFLGPDNYCLVIVPPKIWSGFKAIGTDTAIIANCSTLPHESDEIKRLDENSPYILYDWGH
jgi:dTDP-4-dehydrorhamnose 3,5-epimerase